MTGRIEGGNCIATVTFSADAPPKIATGPSDREIIAALVEALKPFVHLFSRNMDGADPIAGLPDSHLHELIWAADDDDLDFDEGDKRLEPTITTGQLRRARAALKLAGA